MKVHIGILTSRHPEKVLRCIRSLMLQDNVELKISYTVIVNSIKGNYFGMVEEAVNKEFPEMDVINTESNGRPGMGKNAGFDYMRNNVVADYYMLIDGDDFLYPTALTMLQAFMSERYELICGQSQDQWLNGKIYRSWEHLQPNNTVSHNRDLIKPQKPGTAGVYSIDRIYAVSRDFLHKMPRFDESLDLHEDFLFTVECTKIYDSGDLRYISMNNSFIYGYDMDGEHQVGLFSSDKPLAQWNIDRFLKLSEKFIPVLFSKNKFAEITNPIEFTQDDKQEFYNIINSHEAYSRTK